MAYAVKSNGDYVHFTFLLSKISELFYKATMSSFYLTHRSQARLFNHGCGCLSRLFHLKNPSLRKHSAISITADWSWNNWDISKSSTITIEGASWLAVVCSCFPEEVRRMLIIKGRVVLRGKLTKFVFILSGKARTELMGNIILWYTLIISL